jgi:hypothetical protein
MSRAEVFLQYVHDHPGEHLSAIHDESEAKLAQLIAEREAHEEALGESRDREGSPDRDDDVPF